MSESPGPRCNSKTRSGSQCKRWPVDNATRCKIHSGEKMALDVMDPGRHTGTSTTHGRYTHFITDPVELQRYAAMNPLDEVANAEHMLRVTYCVMDRIYEKFIADPDGGIITTKSDSEKGTSTTLMPYALLLVAATDNARKALQTRRDVLKYSNNAVIIEALQVLADKGRKAIEGRVEK